MADLVAHTSDWNKAMYDRPQAGRERPRHFRTSHRMLISERGPSLIDLHCPNDLSLHRHERPESHTETILPPNFPCSPHMHASHMNVVKPIPFRQRAHSHVPALQISPNAQSACPLFAHPPATEDLTLSAGWECQTKSISFRSLLSSVMAGSAELICCVTAPDH